MSVLGLVISLGLFLSAIAVLARPFLRSRQTCARADAQLRQMDQQMKRVQVYYERVLTNMRDLDEDYATGKIDEADYREEREVWAQRGMRLLRLRDSLDARQSLQISEGADADSIDDSIEDEIEAAILAHRAGAPALNQDPSSQEASQP